MSAENNNWEKTTEGRLQPLPKYPPALPSSSMWKLNERLGKRLATSTFRHVTCHDTSLSLSKARHAVARSL